MPQTYSPCPRPRPRPILKRPSAPSTHDCYASIARDESGQLLNIDPSILAPLVRFPPSPTLTRTFQAHSPSTYDRSPIVVSPNHCSLPERGCPGRTYMPGASLSNGDHRHPRASRGYANDEEDDDPTPRATPTIYHHPLPPPLIPDLSSSSESEESEGPPCPLDVPISPASISDKQPFLLPPRIRSQPPPPSPSHRRRRSPKPSSSPTSASAPAPTTNTASASSPRMKPRSKPRHRSTTQSLPSHDREDGYAHDREYGHHNRHAYDNQLLHAHAATNLNPNPNPTADTDDLIVISPSEREPRYKLLSERSMLNACALAVPDLGCLGGF
ncbi:hypothetical protein K474DRAFT_1664109 [Panus rudis PR-1116 ss-1]|nr:hypothetical protein K474DRAFT_1664109 [Panus rudis PR-1116 ss-1]